MNLQLASPPRPAQTAIRRPIRWARLLLCVNVLAILAVAIALRGWRLGNIPGLNGDEAWSGVQAMRLVGAQSIAWRTPTGNPVNPFYLGPLALLHLFLAPSTAVLRIPALVSGLVLLVANFWMSRRVLGSAVAWISTLLLAVLPLNIAYSRFAWDASQSVLAITLVLYLGLGLVQAADQPRRSLLPPFLAYAAAIWIHPTNVFAAWLLIVPVAQCYLAELRTRLERFRACFLARPTGLLVCAGVVVLGLVTVAWECRALLLGVLARAADPTQWGLFVRLLVRLFSGSTIFAFISGPSTGSTALDGLDLAFCCVLALAAFGLLQVLRDPSAERQRCLALGSLTMAISFFLVAGPAAIAPHAERYGACLIAPGTALIAVGLGYWLNPQRRFARLSIATLCLLAWSILGAFGWRYFASIERTGGQSHLAFRTAAEEPKQTAWNYIAQHSADRPIVVVADSWWIYWPLAYLSAEHAEARVLHSDQVLPEEFSQNSPPAMWLVDFCESPDDGRNGGRPNAPFTARRSNARKTVINDYSGRPLLTLEAIEPELVAD